jgi:hypothetical protein
MSWWEILLGARLILQPQERRPMGSRLPKAELIPQAVRYLSGRRVFLNSDTSCIRDLFSFTFLLKAASGEGYINIQSHQIRLAP